MRPQPIGDTEKDVIMGVDENNNVEKNPKWPPKKNEGVLLALTNFSPKPCLYKTEQLQRYLGIFYYYVVPTFRKILYTNESTLFSTCFWSWCSSSWNF